MGRCFSHAHTITVTSVVKAGAGQGVLSTKPGQCTHSESLPWHSETSTHLPFPQLPPVTAFVTDHS